MCRNPAPSREKGKEVAGTIGARTCRSIGAQDADLGHMIADCLRSGEQLATTRMVAFGEYVNDGTASTLKMRDYKDATDLVAIAFEPGIAGREGNESRFTHEVTGTLRKAMGDNQTAVAFSQAIPLNSMTMQGRPSDTGRMGSGIGEEGDPCPTISKAHHHAVAIGTDMFNGAFTGDVAVPLTNRADGTGTGPTVMQSTAVRRLTPTECERLQGFPDGYTAIPWKKKTADQCPDGPRYKALGNSMAVPVMRWIGERINKVNKEQS